MTGSQSAMTTTVPEPKVAPSTSASAINSKKPPSEITFSGRQIPEFLAGNVHVSNGPSVSAININLPSTSKPDTTPSAPPKKIASTTNVKGKAPSQKDKGKMPNDLPLTVTAKVLQGKKNSYPLSKKL